MKINLSPSDKRSVQKISQTRDENEQYAALLCDYIAYDRHRIKSKQIDDMVLAKKLTIEEAFTCRLLQLMELDSQLSDPLTRGIHLLDINDYIHNAYYQQIKIPDFRQGKWALTHEQYMPYEGFICDELSIYPQEAYREINILGFFTQRFEFPAVKENDVIWMSITPHEIATMADDIKAVSGRVVVFGLGLGYYPFMISQKTDVQQVVIVEKDERVISIFKQIILPQFSHPEKIIIVHDDALSYVSHMEDFDYAYVDLWHDVTDGAELYIRMQGYAEKYKKTRFLYWIEKSLLTYLRRLLLVLIEEQLSCADIDYNMTQTFDDVIIKEFYRLTSSLSIKTIAEVYQLLDDASIRRLIKEFSI